MSFRHCERNSEKDAMQRQISTMRKLVCDICLPGRRSAVKIALLAASFACDCASGHAAEFGNDHDTQLVGRHASSSRGRAILPAQILAASRVSAYDAVLKLRPGLFTNDRFAGSGAKPVLPSVILDRGQIEGLEVLRFVSVDVIREIEFIEPSEARTLYGSAYSAGIIVVRLTTSSLP
jgi:hypothetical protein